MTLVVSLILPFVIYALALWVMNHQWRKRMRLLFHELAASKAMNEALVHRLVIRGPYCEICHEKIVEPQAIALRLGPGGYDVFGHALCFPPMP